MLDDPLDQRCLRGITVNVELADAAEIAAARRARRGNSRPAAQSTALLRQIEPDMQLAQLLGRDLGRRTHHQILGALVHRKEYDFAHVLFPAEQPHDAVAADRRCARAAASAQYTPRLSSTQLRSGRPDSPGISRLPLR